MKKLFVTLVMALIASPIFAQMTIEEIESLNKTNPKAAKKEATKFFKKNKKNLDAVVDLARMFMKEKDYATAENLAQMALSVNNKNANVHIFLGDYWYTLDDAGQAASEYEQAVNANPQDTTAYIRYANIYKDKFPVQARQMLEKMGQNCPDVNVKKQIANMYYRGNHPKEAAEAYKECDINTLSELDLANYVFSLSLGLKDFKTSNQICEFGAAKYPDQITFKRFRIYNLADMQQFQLADSLATTFFADNTIEKNFLDYIYHGHILKGAKKYELALEAFSKALEMNDKRNDIYAAMADVNNSLKRDDQAIEMYKKYLSTVSSPTSTMISTMGNYYYDKFQNDSTQLEAIQEADKYYAQAVQMQPNFYMTHLYRGRGALAFCNDLAFECLSKAKELAEGKAPQSVINLIVKYLRQTGKYEEPVVEQPEEGAVVEEAPAQ